MKSAKALGEISKTVLDDVDKRHPIGGLLFGSLGAIRWTVGAAHTR